jgi:hypothetical protein
MSETFANEPPNFGKPIELGGRAVPADDLPVPEGPATLPMWARPRQGPYRLELRNPYWWLSPFPFWLLAGVAVTASAFKQGWPLQAGAGAAQAAAILVVLFPVGLLSVFWYRKVLLPRVAFDQEAGQLVLGWRGLRGRRPLSSVLGVQVMETRKQYDGAGPNSPALTMYQVNLILDDPAERRLNVFTCDPLTARRHARTIADFLGVPVLDSAARQAGAGGAAAPAPMPHGVWAIPAPVLSEPEPDVLLIRPRRLALLTGVQWAGLMVPALLLSVLAVKGGAGDWGSVLLGVSVAGSALMIVSMLLQNLGRWARFDRARGVLTFGWMMGRRGPQPLTSAKAVEVVGGSDSRMNLLLDDERQPRFTLVADADGALVWRVAERVASFLGVPLVDARRRAAETAGAGAVPNPLEELHRSPLPPGKATVRGPARLVPKGEDVLVLRPRVLVRKAQLITAVITTGGALYLVWFFWLAPPPGAGQAGLGQPPWWLLVLLFSPLSLFSAVKPLLVGRDHFDRQAGLLTLGWFGLRGTYPLARVVAVQLVPGGLVQQAGGPLGQGRERVSYQVNLVTADAHQDRLNLTDDSDLEWARQAGQQLADFLGVPLIDQVADDD